MDTILLSISVYINSSMFRKSYQTSLKAASSTTDESVLHPLPTMFRLLGLTPSKKAEFTPSDLYSKKRPLNSKQTLKRCMDLVKKGGSVFFFPEGTRSKDGKLGVFKYKRECSRAAKLSCGWET